MAQDSGPAGPFQDIAGEVQVFQLGKGLQQRPGDVHTEAFRIQVAEFAELSQRVRQVASRMQAGQVQVFQVAQSAQGWGKTAIVKTVALQIQFLQSVKEIQQWFQQPVQPIVGQPEPGYAALRIGGDTPPAVQGDVGTEPVVTVEPAGAGGAAVQGFQHRPGAVSGRPARTSAPMSVRAAKIQPVRPV